MNRDIIAGNWKQFSGKAKAKWGNLTGRQGKVIDGKRIEVSGKIQQDIGIARDATKKQMHDNRLRRRSGD